MVHFHSFSALSLTITAATALRVPFKHAKRATGSTFDVHGLKTLAAEDGGNLNLNTQHDLLYMANITIAGKDYSMQLDTGSSDLWIKGAQSPIPNTEQTTITYNLTYASGWASGHVAYAEAEFAGIKIPKQAFLDVTDAENNALSYGASGIIGLGFTSLSTIDALVNRTNSDDGRSLLFNIFEDDPQAPNFISFALQRSTQQGDDVEGAFTIGEYEPKYEAVKDQPPISTFPVHSPKRWNVLLEALLVGDKVINPTTNVSTAPSNRAVILLDSGTSFTYVPPEIAEAIYGGISGAKLDPAYGQWTVPCNVEIDIALQLGGGQIFPLHPLDVSPKSLGDDKLCLGSFVPQSFAVGDNQFDWLVGVNSLRSMYSIYDFGDFDASGKMGDPYVKLLSLTDPNEASAEFAKERGGTARTGITYRSFNSTAAASASSDDVSSELADKVNTMASLFPVLLALLALNSFVILAAAIAGCYFLRRRRSGAGNATPRPIVGRMTPMPVSNSNSKTSSFVSPMAGSSSDPHVYEAVGYADEEGIPMDRRDSTYNEPLSPPPKGFYNNQPISMALTEDTLFVPPSPGYKGKGFSSFKGDIGDRPMSVA